MQGAPRFPIKLPVALKSTSAVNQSGITGQGVSGKTVETENISANGVLFRMDADVPVGSAVDFTLSLPADVVGAEADVQVDCRSQKKLNLLRGVACHVRRRCLLLHVPSSWAGWFGSAT